MALTLKMRTRMSGDKTSIVVQDQTGVYAAGTNPGGWGGINFPLSTTTLSYFRYSPAGSNTSYWFNITGARQVALFSGQEVNLYPSDFGLSASMFPNGEHTVEWMVLQDHVSPGDLTSEVLVDVQPNDRTITLSDTSEIADLRLALQPRAAVVDVTKSVPVNLIDMDQVYTATTAELERAWDYSPVAPLFPVVLYPVISVFMTISISDDLTKCIIEAIGGLATRPDACDQEVDRVVYMTISKTALDLQVACGNIGAAEDIRTVLSNMCGLNANCGCS